MIITFLTDFGMRDGYVAQMKGVAAGITDATLVDISHAVPAHNVRKAAYILQSVVPYYPVGSVHVVVVDPGVGTERKGLIVTTQSHVFVGPDNGVLMPAAHFLGDFVVYELYDSSYLLNTVSNTFHGRDIFAPVAAHITKGVPFDKLGKITDTYVDLSFGTAEFRDHRIRGSVMYIDHFGNVVTNIPGLQMLDVVGFGSKVSLSFPHTTVDVTFHKTYGAVQKNEPLLTIGSNNYVELGVNQGNAAQQLSLREDLAFELRY